jgi:hypothetical protein
MFFKSHTYSLLLLGVTSVLFSRTMLILFNDPEGPNLLVVMGIAAVMYVVSVMSYMRLSSTSHLKRLLVVLLIQFALAIGLYLLFNVVP